VRKTQTEQERQIADEPRGSVIAVTGEDDRFAAARRTGVEEAIDRGLPLILYDWDSASWFGEPLPNQWASEGAEDRLPDRLAERHLEFVGRHSVAVQVRDARQHGADAYAWLPKDHGPAALATYAAQQQAVAIVLPQDLTELDGLEAILNGSTQPAKDLRSATAAELIFR
jgi:hypothetical protein